MNTSEDSERQTIAATIRKDIRDRYTDWLWGGNASEEIR
jgi:hypothetical protein